MDNGDNEASTSNAAQLRLQNEQALDSRTEMTTPTLTDLPPELLLKIVGYLEVKDHTPIRQASTSLLALSNTALWHDFSKTLHVCMSTDPCGPKSATLRAMQYASEVFLYCGFKMLFCESLFIALDSTAKKHLLDFEPNDAMDYLMTFNSILWNKASNYEPHTGLMYLITLLRNFKHNTDATIGIAGSQPNEMFVHIEIRGPFIGILWTPVKGSREHLKSPIYFLFIISELLLANISDRSYQRVIRCGEDVYIVGHSPRDAKRRPHTVFKFTINCSRRVNTLVQASLSADLDSLVWPVNYDDDECSFKMDMLSLEAQKWGCPNTYYMLSEELTLRFTSNEEEEVD